jgi:hypothetical protein
MIGRFSPIKHRSWRAQGMVEFALALPIFLLVVIGIMEFGRLMLIYSSVFSASREAARYGASVGLESGVSRYQDCVGIRDAAVRVGFFAGVNPSNVDVRYDNGQYYQDQFDMIPRICPASADLGDRLIVRVSVPYRPMFGFIPTGGETFTISNISARSIIKDVYILTELEETPTPRPSRTPTPGLETNTPTGPTLTPSYTPETPTPTIAPPALCSNLAVETVILQQNNTDKKIYITNNSGFNLRLISLTPYFASSQRYLSNINWNGATIWSGQRYTGVEVSSSSFTGPANLPIGQRYSITLTLLSNTVHFNGARLLFEDTADPTNLCFLNFPN